MPEGAPGVMVTSGLVGVMVSPCVGGSSHPTPRRRGARRQAKSARALRAFREVSPAVPSCAAAGQTADPNRLLRVLLLWAVAGHGAVVGRWAERLLRTESLHRLRGLLRRRLNR